jgi:hypothetical protein
LESGQARARSERAAQFAVPAEKAKHHSPMLHFRTLQATSYADAVRVSADIVREI